MAYLPGNFIHGTAIKLQYRLFLIPWLKWNDGVICGAKGRDCSSSSPVKYIPRKYSKKEESEAVSLPVKHLEKRRSGPELNLARHDFSNKSSMSFLEVNSKNDDACLTSDATCGLNLEVEEEIEGDFMAVNDELIEEPDKIGESGGKRCCGMQSVYSRQDVEKSAIELLASRAFTAVELKKKLQGKRFSLEIVDAVITDFQSRGLINDCICGNIFSIQMGFLKLGSSPNQTSTIQERDK